MLTQDQVREELRKEVERYGSLSALARAWDVSRPYLSCVLAGKQAPGELVLRRLGLRSVLLYDRVSTPRVNS